MSPILTLDQLEHLVDRVDPAFTRFNNMTSLRNTGAFLEQSFGNAVAFQDSKKSKSTYYNRVIGFRAEEIPQLADIVSWYDRAALNCTVSLPAHRQSEKVLSALHDKGFQYTGADYNFALRNQECMHVSPSIGVETRRVNDESLRVLFDLFRSSGSILEFEAIQQNRELFIGADFQFFIAYLDGVPAASASVGFFENVTWLNNAITQEDYRGRGCQTALLQTRINAARDQGCSLILSDTEFGSTSHRNSVFRMAVMLPRCFKASVQNWEF